MDESSLAANITGKTLRGLFGPLDNTQLAPPGFLVAEWAVARALGASRLALRLVPLLGGLASLGLFLKLARRCLRPGAAWVALGLFAVADDLIYFASELKQYSTDVAAAIAGLLLGLSMRARPATARRLARDAAAGAALAWVSHPSAFVLAGAGLLAFGAAVRRRAWREAGGLVLVGAAWGASFLVVRQIGMEQLGHGRGMWAFWDFAFPPWPPRSAWDAAWPLRRFLYLFANPLSTATPLGPRLSAVPWLALFLVGAHSMWRRDRALFSLLMLPGLMALMASYARIYPFHGRLLLFLVPGLLLVIAEGAGRVRDRVGRGAVWMVVLAALFLFPAWGLVYHLVEPRDRDGFHPHGDLRPATLDPYRFPL